VTSSLTRPHIDRIADDGRPAEQRQNQANDAVHFMRKIEIEALAEFVESYRAGHER
jgi:hypothetical protein